MEARRVGRFRIDGPLGKGGMATVWRAEDELLGRTVALKLLADDLAESPSARRRFGHEAEIATMLDHPAIAPVYAHGEDDGVAWIAMRLVEGETLAARIARAPLPVDEALRMAADVADALGYAHALGVVHRDVTSNNVMLAKDGRVFVMDFGLARAEGFSRITSTGVAMGTYAYLAPEVLKGAMADARSDLYGLGITLYEMLTGSTPFAGERVETLAYRAANEDPEPPSRRRAGIGEALDAFVLRAIAREPAARFPDAAAFGAALAVVRASRNGSGPGPPAPASLAGVLARALAPGGVVYLAVAPIECGSASLAPLGTALEGALRARLPGPGRPRVIDSPAPADPAAWREWARGAGANAILGGRLRESGASLRLELWLTDPESGARLAGGHADGLSFEPFALEDAAVREARRLLGDSSELARATTQAMRADPAADEHFAQAKRHLERHDQEASVDRAIGLLDRLVATEGARAEWYAALARACLMKYDLTRQRAWEARASEACARACGMSPDGPEVLLARADLMRVAGREANALDGYERALRANPCLVEAWLGLAMLHGNCGRMAEAEEAAERAIAIAPRDWRGHNALGYGRLRFGRIRDALGPLERAAELSPDNARVRRNLALMLSQCDRLQESAAVLREAVALEPSDSAYSSLGAMLFALGDGAGALDAFERATRLAPADPQRWGNLASALRFEPGRESDAAAAYDRAIGLMQDQLARDPGVAEWWALLADWLQARDRPAEADAALTRALAIGPENVSCMVHAAYVLHQRGDREGTLAWLRRAVSHGQGAEMLRKSAEFRDLQDDPEFRSMLDEAARRRESEPTAQGRAHQEDRT